MAKTLTVAKMMDIVAAEGWAVTVQPHDRRFYISLWNADGTGHVDAAHYSFGGALHRALRLAWQAQRRQDADELRAQHRQSGPALPSPELLAMVIERATEVVA